LPVVPTLAITRGSVGTRDADDHRTDFVDHQAGRDPGNLAGAINDRFERGGLRIIAQKRIQLSQSQAERFYEVHAGRPFYRDLVAFMSSGPVVVQVLEGENAVALNREIMGATNPANAAPGTIRKDFAESIEANSVHGSDSPETAAQEIAFFFSAIEICP